MAFGCVLDRALAGDILRGRMRQVFSHPTAQLCQSKHKQSLSPIVSLKYIGIDALFHPFGSTS
eukprot:10958235-Lingulodinium_polyedra.AAC.1